MCDDRLVQHAWYALSLCNLSFAVSQGSVGMICNSPSAVTIYVSQGEKILIGNCMQVGEGHKTFDQILCPPSVLLSSSIDLDAFFFRRFVG